MKRLIIINGVMGVGKTTVCKVLNKELPKSVWLDGDWCWMMNPFVVNESTKKMVQENICFMLNNFLKQDEFENIIFNWVIDEEEIYDLILKNLNRDEFELFKITLMCSEETLVKRIEQDIKDGKRAESSIEKSLKRLKKYELINSFKVNTDSNQIDKTIKSIRDILNYRNKNLKKEVIKSE